MVRSAEGVPAVVGTPAVLPWDGDMSLTPAQILVGDEVMVTRSDPGEPFESAQGVVAVVAADSVTLGTRVFRLADGWRFELLRRDVVMPEAVSEVQVWLHGSVEPVALIGRGDLWRRVDDGSAVDVSEVRRFEVVSRDVRN